MPYARGDVLELGCGTGRLHTRLRSAGVNAIGLDYSPQMLRRARKYTQSTMLLRGDVRELSFTDDSFDCILASFPSDYISDPRTLAEVTRVLRPGGALHIALAATRSDTTLNRRLSDTAYRLIGQPPAQPIQPTVPVPFAQALARAGLASDAFWVAAGDASVLVIRATQRGAAAGTDA